MRRSGAAADAAPAAESARRDARAEVRELSWGEVGMAGRLSGNWRDGAGHCRNNARPATHIRWAAFHGAPCRAVSLYGAEADLLKKLGTAGTPNRCAGSEECLDSGPFTLSRSNETLLVSP